MIDIQNKSKEFKNDSLSWPPGDIEKLLSRMRQHIPPNDHLKHQSRAARLPWNLIAFDDYTDSQCQHMWNLIFQRLRGFRLLDEVLSDAVEWLQHPWTDFYSRKSKNQHPDRPKKPMSTFFLYCADHMESVKEEFPKLSLPERTKVVAERYRNLKEKKKAKYIKKAELSQQEYKAQLEIFLAEHPEETTDREKVRKQPRKLTAFNLYVEDQLKKRDLTKKKLKDVFTLLRKQWKELPADDQLPWLQAAEEKQREIIMTDPSAKSTLTKAEKKIHDRHNGKPDKPPATVYGLFAKSFLGSETLAGYSPQERMKELSRRWKAIDAEKQAALLQQLNKEKLKYEIDLKEYLKQYPEEASKLSVEKPKKATIKRVRKNTATFADEGLIEDSDNFDLSPSLQTPTKKKNTKDEVDASETKTPKSMNGNLDYSIDGKKKKNKTFDKSEEVESIPVINDTPKTKKRKRDEEDQKPIIDIETNVEKKKKKKAETPEVDLNVSLNDTISQKISLFEGEPKPPPKLPIKLFAKSMKKQKVKYASEEELNEAWNNLSSLERKTYKKALKKVKETYMAEFETFLCSLSSKDLKKYKKSKIEAA